MEVVSAGCWAIGETERERERERVSELSRVLQTKRKEDIRRRWYRHMARQIAKSAPRATFQVDNKLRERRWER